MRMNPLVLSCALVMSACATDAPPGCTLVALHAEHPDPPLPRLPSTYWPLHLLLRLDQTSTALSGPNNTGQSNQAAAT